MTEEQVIAAVKARMADIMPDNQSEVTAQPFIESLVNGCVENFYKMLPLSLLPVTSFLSESESSVTSSEVQVKRKKLPTGFVRFIELKCAPWEIPATTVLQQGSPEHNAQFNKYSFGGNCRPKVTLVNDENNGKCIEYYNYYTETPIVVQTATCAVFSTLADIPDKIVDPFAWYTASVVYHAMEELEASKSAMLRVSEFLELQK